MYQILVEIINKYDEARNILMDSIKDIWISSKIKASCSVTENLLLAPPHDDSHITKKAQKKIICLNFLPVLIEDCNTTSAWIYNNGILYHLMFNLVIYNTAIQQSFHQPETVRHLGSIRKEEE